MSPWGQIVAKKKKKKHIILLKDDITLGVSSFWLSQRIVRAARQSMFSVLA